MRILVVNCGSSTLKLQILDVDTQGGDPCAGRRLVDGSIDRIGHQGSIKVTAPNGVPDLIEDA